jgi:hypothetical protein
MKLWVGIISNTALFWSALAIATVSTGLVTFSNDEQKCRVASGHAPDLEEAMGDANECENIMEVRFICGCDGSLSCDSVRDGLQ